MMHCFYINEKLRNDNDLQMYVDNSVWDLRVLVWVNMYSLSTNEPYFSTIKATTLSIWFYKFRAHFKHGVIFKTHVVEYSSPILKDIVS